MDDPTRVAAVRDLALAAEIMDGYSDEGAAAAASACRRVASQLRDAGVSGEVSGPRRPITSETRPVGDQETPRCQHCNDPMEPVEQDDPLSGRTLHYAVCINEACPSRDTPAGLPDKGGQYD